MPRAVWRFVALWILPPLCVLGLVYVTPKIPETYRAWRGHGQVGSLDVTRVEFGKRCRYFGPWTSQDGARTLHSVWVDDLNRDDCRYRVGDHIRSLFVGNHETVYVAGDYAFWFAALVPLACLAYLLGGVGYMVRRRREA